MCTVVQQPLLRQGLYIIDDSRSHSDAQHSVGLICLQVISPTQKLLPDDTQHSQDANIHDPSGIRNNPSKRAAAQARL